ncbi:MAG: rhodanese-like domain-containing protein [Ilumatobacteraceae bacterium]
MVRRRARIASVAALTGSLALALVSCGGDDTGTATPTSATAVDARIELISASATQQLLDAPPAGLVVLDVRTPEEFAAGHLAGAIDLDYRSATFADDLAELDRDVPYLVYCHSGNRSAGAVAAMRELGFTIVSELDGGITAWQAAGYPVTS